MTTKDFHDSMTYFIKQRSALNHRELAKLIEWSPSSFHQWLKGKRPIPDEKAKLLAEVLFKYGYMYKIYYGKPVSLNLWDNPKK